MVISFIPFFIGVSFKFINGGEHCAASVASVHPHAFFVSVFFPVSLFLLRRNISTQTFSFGFGVAVGAAVGFDVGAAVGLAVGAVVGFVAGLVVAVGLEVGFAVGAAVGLVVDAVVGFAVAEGFAVALLPEDGLLTVLLPELGFVVADGFAVALGFDTVLPVELEDDGLLVVLFSVLDEADELLPFELSVLLLSVFALGVAVGFALAVLELAAGLLLASFFSDTVLPTALDVELSVTMLSVLLPAHAASETISAAAINIAVIFFFIVVHSSYRIL